MHHFCQRKVNSFSFCSLVFDYAHNRFIYQKTMPKHIHHAFWPADGHHRNVAKAIAPCRQQIYRFTNQETLHFIRISYMHFSLIIRFVDFYFTPHRVREKKCSSKIVHSRMEAGERTRKKCVKTNN